MSLSSHCQNYHGPVQLTSLLQIQQKKAEVAQNNADLVNGQKTIKSPNTTVGSLANGRAAIIKANDFKSGLENVAKAINVLEMAAFYAEDAKCSLMDLKKVAADASSPMHDMSRGTDYQPQFKHLLDGYVDSLKHYTYDCMNILDGKFKHSFITSSACGAATKDSIDLRSINLTPLGLGLIRLVSEKTEVDNIESGISKVQQKIQALVDVLGNKDEVKEAQVLLLAEMGDLKTEIQNLFKQTDNDSDVPNSDLERGGPISDAHMKAIKYLRNTYVDEFFDEYQDKINTLNVHAPSNKPGIGDAPAGADKETTTDITNMLKDAMKKLVTIKDTEFAAVQKTFVYNTLFPEYAIDVKTYNNAVQAEHVLDKGLEVITNGLTKIHAKTSALMKIGALLEGNYQLHNKVAHDNCAVDHIETNAEICKNKTALETAIKGLKDSLKMNELYSNFSC